MSKYQVQRREKLFTHAYDGDVTYDWRDIVSDGAANCFGPASKAAALDKLERIRRKHPDEVYRIVKLVKEK